MRKSRHIKSKKKNTWTNLRSELAQLSKQLNISVQDFSEVGIDEWKNIKTKVWSMFSIKKDAVWIWEYMKQPFVTTQINYRNLRLGDFIDGEDIVWFILDETINEKTKFWIYEGKVNAFDSILNQSYSIYEIIVVSKKYEWILLHNHHDTLLGTGSMKDKIEKYN